MEYKLSILIPVHEDHAVKSRELIDFLKSQQGDDVEVITYLNKGERSKGYYRNELLSWAKGKYICFVDADDWVSENYVYLLLKGIQENPTHISLKGVITTNGQNPETFEHSNKYSKWSTNHSGEVMYERYPNHLNCIRADIAKQFSFPDINHGEDHKWAEKVHNSGLLTEEYYINNILYHYRFIPK